ncbi:DNA translocase FtsK [Patescibacteria group bacterium]|nr:DNA translocase FtsK [Patescibacteria group bacterium]MBU1931069.1 DNA translocase FtsK [Patescibacteria group bacterium]
MGKNRRSRGRRHQPFKLKLKKETLYSISSAWLIILGCLVILSFSRQGRLLILFYNLGTDWFGWGLLLVPFLLLSSGLMLVRLKWRITRPNVFIGSFLIFIALVGLTQAGIIGLFMWRNIAVLISATGAFVVFLGSCLVGFVILFETSLEEILLFANTSWKTCCQVMRVIFKKSPRVPPTEKRAELKVQGMMPGKSTQDSIDSEKEKSKSAKGEQLPLRPQVVSNQPGKQRALWQLPPLEILSETIGGEAERGDIKKNAAVIEKTLESFGIKARVVEVNCGPAVTQYALEIALGTKLSKITALQSDLALALAASRGQIRIEAPIPGRSLVGVEVPNTSLEIVPLKKMLLAEKMKEEKQSLAIGLGLNVSGDPIIDNIARMPHVLIAGSTGSGKSVCINSIISTILFRASPEEVKLILVDPKRVELTQYNGIPHLLTPVIVEPEKVVSALKWALEEMERRYKVFASVGARNIGGYNELTGFQAMPYLMIVVDELADVMLFAPSEVEDSITRLAQMARATGIHLVVSTQRPSVDVITGLIKANIPCRIAFNVTSMVDSRVIIDMPGAEKLLGQGDMLYIPPDQAKPTRIQGAFISDGEIKKLIDFLKKTGVKPQYTEEVTSKYKPKVTGAGGIDLTTETDELFNQAIKTVCQYDRASASLLQRRLSIGYARAARILDQLEANGVVSPAEGSKPRDVLIQNAETFLSQREFS